MDPEFPEWYQDVDLTPGGEILAKRWEGVEKFSASLCPAGVADAVRSLYGLPPKDAEFAAGFRAVFHAADQGFVARGNEREIQVLAGAVLANAMAKRFPLADVAALMVRTADAQGLRQTTAPRFALDRANRYLRERSSALRQPEQLAPLELPKGFTSDTAPLLGDAAPDAAAVAKAAKAIAHAVQSVATSTAKSLELLAQTHRLCREETEILWWAFGGYSRDLEQPFATLPLGARVLIAPKELIDLIAVMPGPVSSIALLDRLIFGPSGNGRNEMVTIRRAVEEAPGKWLESWAKDLPGLASCSDLCPAALAAQRASEGGGAESWVGVVERVTHVAPTAQTTPLRLALQAFDEHRLLRSLAAPK